METDVEEEVKVKVEAGAGAGAEIKDQFQVPQFCQGRDLRFD